MKLSTYFETKLVKDQFSNDLGEFGYDATFPIKNGTVSIVTKNGRVDYGISNVELKKSWGSIEIMSKEFYTSHTFFGSEEEPIWIEFGFLFTEMTNDFGQRKKYEYQVGEIPFLMYMRSNSKSMMYMRINDAKSVHIIDGKIEVNSKSPMNEIIQSIAEKVHDKTF